MTVPGQTGRSGQDWSSVVDSVQVPAVQVRVLVCVPVPQVLSQAPHSPQALHSVNKCIVNSGGVMSLMFQGRRKNAMRAYATQRVWRNKLGCEGWQIYTTNDYLGSLKE